jgi:hypothetical protein
MDERWTPGHHPNDQGVVRDQLRRSVLYLSPDERAALVAHIDRQIAEIDAKQQAPDEAE